MESYLLEEKLDIAPFVAEAIGNNPTTYKDIEWIYLQDLEKYTEGRKEKHFITSVLVSAGSLEREEYMKKAYALLMFIDEAGVKENIIKVIKKAWPYAYTYVINKEQIDLGAFVASLQKRQTISLDEINSNLTIAIALTMYLGKQLIATPFTLEFLELLSTRNELNYSKKYFEFNREIIPKEAENQTRKARMSFDSKNSTTNNISDLENNSCSQPMAKSLQYLFKSEGFNLGSLTKEIKLNEKDIDSCHYARTMAELEPRIDIREHLYLLAIKSLLRRYKETKENYFKKEKDISYSEEKLLDEIKILSFKNAKKDLEILELKRKNKKLEKDLCFTSDIVLEYSQKLRSLNKEKADNQII